MSYPECNLLDLAPGHNAIFSAASGETVLVLLTVEPISYSRLPHARERGRDRIEIVAGDRTYPHPEELHVRVPSRYTGSAGRDAGKLSQYVVDPSKRRTRRHARDDRYETEARADVLPEEVIDFAPGQVVVINVRSGEPTFVMSTAYPAQYSRMRHDRKRGRDLIEIFAGRSRRRDPRVMGYTIPASYTGWERVQSELDICEVDIEDWRRRGAARESRRDSRAPAPLIVVGVVDPAESPDQRREYAWRPDDGRRPWWPVRAEFTLEDFRALRRLGPGAVAPRSTGWDQFDAEHEDKVFPRTEFEHKLMRQFWDGAEARKFATGWHFMVPYQGA